MTRNKANRPQAIRAPLLIMGAGVLFLVAALALLSWSPGSSPVPTATLQALSPADVPRVSLDEAKAAFDAGEAAFLDVRQGDDFAASHIPGALSISLSELETRVSELEPSDWIITYCT
jgi:3-mercaptopyruvate sulfurtransferase SseA